MVHGAWAVVVWVVACIRAYAVLVPTSASMVPPMAADENLPTWERTPDFATARTFGFVKRVWSRLELGSVLGA